MLRDVYSYMTTVVGRGKFPTNVIFDILHEADLTRGNKDNYRHINDCLIRASISGKITISQAYLLLLDQYLYEYLSDVGIHHGYFMVALGNYIIYTANLNRDLLFDVYSVENTEPQKVFNSISRQIIKTLEVFYD